MSMSYYDIDSGSSEYLDLNRRKGQTRKHKIEKVATTNTASSVLLSSSSSTTLSPLTDTSYESTASKSKAGEKVFLASKMPVKNDNIDPILTENPLVQQQSNPTLESLHQVLKCYHDALAQNSLSVSQLLGSEDSEYSVVVCSKYHKNYRNEKSDEYPSQPEIKHIYDHNNKARRLSEKESVQTTRGHIHHNHKELDHWEYETPLSDYWYIKPPEDPKMALISLLVETHRRIVGYREHPNLHLRNTVDYGLSSLKVNCDIDPECCGCTWPYIHPEEIPEDLKDANGNRKYYFLTSQGQGYDWEDQDFSAPLTYLVERRKKLKDLVLMMKEELFYITERFLDLSKKFRHKIVRDSRLRKRFEAVGLDLVYKRAHLDNMHHLYHRVKKLYEAYLPLCHET